MKKYSLQEVINITRKEIMAFEKVEQRKWGIEANVVELVKQVGDLAKHVMVQEKYYLKEREGKPEYKTNKQDIADELADIFFCLVRLADLYKIDLEKALFEARWEGLRDRGIKSIKSKRI